jgi:hypothetical protein
MRATLLLALACQGCAPDAGGARFTAPLWVRGEDGARAFTNAVGFDVSLQEARLHVGAVYLNQSMPARGTLESSCTLPGRYTAQALGSFTVDLLDPVPRRAPPEVDATDQHSRASQVWFVEGDPNRSDDDTVVLTLRGVARRGADEIPFRADVTVGRQRQVPIQDPALPGSAPICQQRMATPIPVDLALVPGDGLLLTVDVRSILATVNFSALPEDSVPRTFTDRADNAADISLFNGLKAATGVYAFRVLAGGQP